MADDLLFTYGTLRTGESNTRWLAGARYCGIWKTQAHYALWDAGAYPAATKRGNTSIVGEVYHVSQAILAQVDVLEGYPLLYTRRRIETDWGAAWIYLWAGAVDPAWSIIANGDWCTHRHRATNGVSF